MMLMASLADLSAFGQNWVRESSVMPESVTGGGQTGSEGGTLTLTTAVYGGLEYNDNVTLNEWGDGALALRAGVASSLRYPVSDSNELRFDAAIEHVQYLNWKVVIANAEGQNDNAVNIGPSNAGMVYSTGGQATLPINSYAAVNGTNYSYVTASASNTTLGNVYDLDGGGSVDALLSWTVPYADFVSAVNSSAVMGTSFGFNQDTLFTVTVVTSNTQNTVNQDVGGVTGLSVNFVYSAPISAATPVPEPSTAVILAALFGPFLVRRRRRA